MTCIPNIWCQALLMAMTNDVHVLPMFAEFHGITDATGNMILRSDEADHMVDNC